jgi:uncharacterized protein
MTATYIGKDYQMLYRRFGKTELMTSIFSFGAMRIPDGSDENAVETLKRSVELGINHLETARGYGTSEALLGLAMPELPRDELIITTKIGPTDSADEMRQSIDESLERMKVDHIDVLDIHGINTAANLEKTLSGGSLEGIHKAMNEGLVRHIGFSTHGPLDVILDTIKTGEFETVNLHYYYINQRNLPAIELANSLDMGVYIISPTDKGGQLFKAPAKLRSMCEPLTPIQMNHRFLLSNPGIHTLSLGASTPEEFAEHLAIADKDGPLDAQEQKIKSGLDAEFHTVLGDTFCTTCDKCLPCPELIHIPEMLRLRNLARTFDMTEFGKYRYNLFSRGGDWHPGDQATACTECGDCLPRCPEKLEIPKLLTDTHTLLLGEAEAHMYASNE